ncbi:MAG: hypothetical protein AAFN77_12620 [Planctomycetota bacterium]
MNKSKPDKPSDGGHDDSEPSWFERNVNSIIFALVIACVLTVATQRVFGLGYDEQHPAHFPQEEWLGFQAIFGFVVFIVIVFLGRALRLIVERPEDYYDA